MNETQVQQAYRLIQDERDRQINEEKWDATHDDSHVDGSLWKAAQFYANVAIRPAIWAYANFKQQWPWSPEWFKPWTKIPERSTTVDSERCLIKSGALIKAEQARLERALEKVALKLAEKIQEKGDHVP